MRSHEKKGTSCTRLLERKVWDLYWFGAFKKRVWGTIFMNLIAMGRLLMVGEDCEGVARASLGLDAPTAEKAHVTVLFNKNMGWNRHKQKQDRTDTEKQDRRMNDDYTLFQPELIVFPYRQAEYYIQSF